MNDPWELIEADFLFIFFRQGLKYHREYWRRKHSPDSGTGERGQQLSARNSTKKELATVNASSLGEQGPFCKVMNMYGGSL